MIGQQLNYDRIAAAIRFIKENRREQPKLEEVAEHVNMSPYHFQRTFQEWAGTSPKHFLQYLNVEYAKHYHWGNVRKTAIIGWEAARKNQGKSFY